MNADSSSVRDAAGTVAAPPRGPDAVDGTRPALSRAASSRRTAVALWIVAAGALAIHFVNTVVPSWSFVLDEWVFRRTLPTMRPLGNDFQVGIYRPAEMLRAGVPPETMASFYPPLVEVLGLPATFLEPQAAYVIHVILLVLANVAALVLVLVLAQRAFGATSRRHAAAARRIVVPLLLVVGFLVVTSYGFTFSLERGNTDIFPLLLCVVVLWLLVERPHTLWIQTALLAVAVHLKVYPLVLFPLVFWAHRWRSVPPFAAMNAALLLMLGWGRAKVFFAGLAIAATSPGIWVGNHSAKSFAKVVLVPAGLSFRGEAALLALLPLALLAAGALVLWFRGFTPVNALLAFALAVPTMNLVPATSHDYKLVILTAPLAILLLGEILNYAVDGGWRPIAAVAGLLAITALLSHAYTMVAPYRVAEPAWLVHRYPWILALQLLVLVQVLAPGGVFRSRSRGDGTAFADASP